MTMINLLAHQLTQSFLVKSTLEVVSDLSEETIKNLLKVEMKSKKISLMELTERTCKWPIGDPATDTFWFCGHDLSQVNHIVKLIFLSLFNQ